MERSKLEGIQNVAQFGLQAEWVHTGDITVEKLQEQLNSFQNKPDYFVHEEVEVELIMGKKAFFFVTISYDADLFNDLDILFKIVKNFDLGATFTVKKDVAKATS